MKRSHMKGSEGTAESTQDNASTPPKALPKLRAAPVEGNSPLSKSSGLASSTASLSRDGLPPYSCGLLPASATLGEKSLMPATKPASPQQEVHRPGVKGTMRSAGAAAGGDAEAPAPTPVVGLPTDAPTHQQQASCSSSPSLAPSTQRPLTTAAAKMRSHNSSSCCSNSTASPSAARADSDGRGGGGHGPRESTATAGAGSNLTTSNNSSSSTTPHLRTRRTPLAVTPLYSSHQRSSSLPPSGSDGSFTLPQRMVGLRGAGMSAGGLSITGDGNTSSHNNSSSGGGFGGSAGDAAARDGAASASRRGVEEAVPSACADCAVSTAAAAPAKPSVAVTASTGGVAAGTDGAARASEAPQRQAKAKEEAAATSPHRPAQLLPRPSPSPSDSPTPLQNASFVDDVTSPTGTTTSTASKKRKKKKAKKKKKAAAAAAEAGAESGEDGDGASEAAADKIRSGNPTTTTSVDAAAPPPCDPAAHQLFSSSGSGGGGAAASPLTTSAQAAGNSSSSGPAASSNAVAGQSSGPSRGDAAARQAAAAKRGNASTPYGYPSYPTTNTTSAAATTYDDGGSSSGGNGRNTVMSASTAAQAQGYAGGNTEYVQQQQTSMTMGALPYPLPNHNMMVAGHNMSSGGHVNAYGYYSSPPASGAAVTQQSGQQRMLVSPQQQQQPHMSYSQPNMMLSPGSSGYGAPGAVSNARQMPMNRRGGGGAGGSANGIGQHSLQQQQQQSTPQQQQQQQMPMAAHQRTTSSQSYYSGANGGGSGSGGVGTNYHHYHSHSGGSAAMNPMQQYGGTAAAMNGNNSGNGGGGYYPQLQGNGSRSPGAGNGNGGAYYATGMEHAGGAYGQGMPQPPYPQQDSPLASPQHSHQQQQQQQQLQRAATRHIHTPSSTSSVPVYYSPASCGGPMPTGYGYPPRPSPSDLDGAEPHSTDSGGAAAAAAAAAVSAQVDGRDDGDEEAAGGRYADVDSVEAQRPYPFTPEVTPRLCRLVEEEVLTYLTPSLPCLQQRRSQLRTLAEYITAALRYASNQTGAPYGDISFYVFGSVNMRTVLPDGDNDVTVEVDGLLAPEASRSPPPPPTAAEAAAQRAAAAARSALPPVTTDSSAGDVEGTLQLTTTADGQPRLAAPAVLSIASGEVLGRVRDYLRTAKTPIFVDSLVMAEVRVLKLVMEGCNYDITIGQFGGVNCVRFLHEMDAAIGGRHLLKRTLLLLKAWSCYEAHVLGGQAGYIGSYAATVMLISMINTVEFLEDVVEGGVQLRLSPPSDATAGAAGSEREGGVVASPPSTPDSRTGQAARGETAATPRECGSQPNPAGADAAAHSPPASSPSSSLANLQRLSPLTLLARFLKFYAHFDFDRYSVTAFGPLPLHKITSVPLDLSYLEVDAAHSSPLEGEAAANRAAIDLEFLGLTAEGEAAIGHLIRRRRQPLLTVSGVRHLLDEVNQSRRAERQARHDARRHAAGASEATAALPATPVELSRAGCSAEDAGLMCPSCNTAAFPVRDMNVLDPLRWSSNMVRGVCRNHLQRIRRAFMEGLRRMSAASQQLGSGGGGMGRGGGSNSSEVNDAADRCSRGAAGMAAPTLTGPIGAASPASLPSVRSGASSCRSWLDNNIISSGSPQATAHSAAAPLLGTPASEVDMAAGGHHNATAAAAAAADAVLYPGYPAPHSQCTRAEVQALQLLYPRTIDCIRKHSGANCPWSRPTAEAMRRDGVPQCPGCLVPSLLCTPQVRRMCEPQLVFHAATAAAGGAEGGSSSSSTGRPRPSAQQQQQPSATEKAAGKAAAAAASGRRLSPLEMMTQAMEEAAAGEDTSDSARRGGPLGEAMVPPLRAPPPPPPPPPPSSAHSQGNSVGSTLYPGTQGMAGNAAPAYGGAADRVQQQQQQGLYSAMPAGGRLMAAHTAASGGPTGGAAAYAQSGTNTQMLFSEDDYYAGMSNGSGGGNASGGGGGMANAAAPSMHQHPSTPQHPHAQQQQQQQQLHQHQHSGSGGGGFVSAASMGMMSGAGTAQPPPHPTHAGMAGSGQASPQQPYVRIGAYNNSPHLGGYYADGAGGGGGGAYHQHHPHSTSNGQQQQQQQSNGSSAGAGGSPGMIGRPYSQGSPMPMNAHRGPYSANAGMSGGGGGGHSAAAGYGGWSANYAPRHQQQQQRGPYGDARSVQGAAMPATASPKDNGSANRDTTTLMQHA